MQGNFEEQHCLLDEKNDNLLKNGRSIKEQWSFPNKENKCALKNGGKFQGTLAFPWGKQMCFKVLKVFSREQHYFYGENVCFEKWMVLLKGGEENMFHNVDIFFEKFNIPLR